ncbi:MAG: hypothetical protein ACYDDU_17410 [Dermatophilaceae bacterium]
MSNVESYDAIALTDTLADPRTWPQPDEESRATDLRYGTVKVSAWHGLHPRLGCRGHWANHDIPPIAGGTLIRVEVEHLPKPTSATKKTLWLWAAGPKLDLDTCWRGYPRRFDIEHTFGQSTKIPNPRPRTTQRNPPGTTNPLPSDQEGRIAKV